MKLIRSVYVVLAIFVSALNCSEQKPKGWKDVMFFANPLAIFRPSIISSGHAQYFGSIDDLNDEQRRNLKQFIDQLEVVKTTTLVANASCAFLAFLYSSKTDLSGRPIFAFIGIGLIIGSWATNSQYLRELNDFKDKIEKVNT